MGLEHNLGLTCDPVAGIVQIPCIERNAFAASKAFNCADYALLSDGSHRIPFDEVVAVLWETGNNLPSLYRETSSGGLAEAYRKRTERRTGGSTGSLWEIAEIHPHLRCLRSIAASVQFNSVQRTQLARHHCAMQAAPGRG